MIPGYQDTRIPGYQDTRIPGYKDTRIPGYQDTRIQEYQDTRNLGIFFWFDYDINYVGLKFIMLKFVKKTFHL